MSEPTRRLLFLASTLPVGGAETHLRDLLRGFQDRGAEPHLWLFKEPGEFGEELIREGRIPMRTGLRLNRSVLSLARKLRSDIRELSPKALITLEHDDVMMIGRLAARFAGVPRSITVMHTTNRRDGGQTLNRANRWMKGFSDLYIATARGHRDHLLSGGLPEERLGAILNGIDTKRFRPRVAPREFALTLGIPEESPVVGMIAAFRPEKNHEFALRAFAKVRERVPGAHMVFLGDGVTRCDSEALAKVLGLSGHAHFLGNRHDVDRIAREFDVVVLTSHPRVETFPLSLLEAMACGCPAVATDVGFISEMVQDKFDGFIVPPGDVDHFSETLASLLLDRKELNTFKKRVRDKIEREFSLVRMMDEYWEAIFPGVPQQQMNPVG